MDNTTCKQVQSVAGKVKKKKVKDDLDRMRQAEKKKRRLEKALATSAAIRSELEKKKEMKKEEQQRLEEEGAAIAEAVALHVLLGEDSDDSCSIMLKEERDFEFNPGGITGNFGIFLERRNRKYLPHQNYLVQDFGFVSNTYESSHSSCSIPYGHFSKHDAYERYFEDDGWDFAGLSAGLMAAQAVSSLQISEDSEANNGIFNGMFTG